MSVGTIIKSVKQIHKEDIVLVQMGKFYYVYGKDAYILSDLFGYKLNEFETNIYSVGFPSNSYSKVISRLEQLKINYLILDKRNNYEVLEFENYKNLNNYDEYFEKAKKEILIKIRIQKINEYLLKNINSAHIKEKIYGIEKILKNDK